MADVTVSPSTFELALTQPAITLPGATHTQSAPEFALALSALKPVPIISFPIISRKPGQVFSEEPSDDAVSIGDLASGYPVINKLFTFDPTEFIFEMPAVLDADKIIIMAFYESHKDLSFPWYNDQDSTWHEVSFAGKPVCSLDGRGDLWRIMIRLRKTSS